MDELFKHRLAITREPSTRELKRILHELRRSPSAISVSLGRTQIGYRNHRPDEA